MISDIELIKLISRYRTAVETIHHLSSRYASGTSGEAATTLEIIRADTKELLSSTPKIVWEDAGEA